jgi:peroxiredoxin-like protein
MKPLPHTYTVRIAAAPAGHATLTSPGVPDLLTAPPLDFDGTGDAWSPEQLLLAAVASCFLLTFRAVAKYSRLEFTSVSIESEGVVDRVDGRTRFTEIVLRPKVAVLAGADPHHVRRTLEKAEANCIVTASLKARITVEPEVVA